MDKGYIQEDREGGVMALGTGVPNVQKWLDRPPTREQWLNDKDEYVYSAWVERTLAQLAAHKESSPKESHER